jgi:hypothetical protein
MEQRIPGMLRVWAEAFTALRVPKLFDLRADPYERADITSNTYHDWLISQPYLFFGAQAATVKFLDTFKAFPPRQRAESFSIDQAVDKMKQSLGSNLTPTARPRSSSRPDLAVFGEC